MKAVIKLLTVGLSGTLLAALSVAGVSGTASAASKSKTITIGLTWPESGPAEPEYDGFGQGATAAFDAANAAGGVDGYKIKLADYDDASSTSGNLAATRALFQNDNALTVIEAPLDPGNIGYLQTTGYPVLTGPGGYNGVSAPLKNLIPVGGRNEQTQFETADLKYLKSLGVTKLALLTEQNAAVLGQALQSYATKSLGMQVVYTNYNFAYVPSDYAPVASAMTAAGVQGVFTILGQPINAAVASAVAEAGEKLKGFDMAGAYNASFAQQDAKVLGSDDSLTGAGFEPLSSKTPGVESYLKNMNKYEPKWTFNEFGEDGYGAGLAAIAGIEKTIANKKPVTRANFLTAMQSIHNFDADGLYLPLKSWYDEDGCEWILKVENGKWVQITKNAICAPFAQL